MNPMNIIKALDPGLYKSVEDTRGSTFYDGAVSEKTKYLIALAIDASHGAEGGVRALAAEAVKLGATKQEVMESLRVANFVAGAGSVYTAARALEGMFP